DEGAPRALGPAHRQFHRRLDRLARGGVGGAFVERHRDIGAEEALNLDRALRGQEMPAAVEMRAERDPFLVDRPQGGERDDLEPDAGPRPSYVPARRATTGANASRYGSWAIQ